MRMTTSRTTPFDYTTTISGRRMKEQPWNECLEILDKDDTPWSLRYIKLETRREETRREIQRTQKQVNGISHGPCPSRNNVAGQCSSAKAPPEEQDTHSGGAPVTPTQSEHTEAQHTEDARIRDTTHTPEPEYIKVNLT